MGYCIRDQSPLSLTGMEDYMSRIHRIYYVHQSEILWYDEGDTDRDYGDIPPIGSTLILRGYKADLSVVEQKAYKVIDVVAVMHYFDPDLVPDGDSPLYDVYVMTRRTQWPTIPEVSVPW